MDASFDLKSSMSPKITKNLKPINKKPPTKLALKKYLRKSLQSVMNISVKHNESIVSIESSSETCSLSNNTNSEETPIIISDCELSFNIKQTTFNTPLKHNNKNENKDCKATSNASNNKTNLNKEKFDNIKQWLNGINDKEQDISRFSEVSTIQKDENHHVKNLPSTKVAASSTLIDPASKRFDELFKNDRNSKNQCEANQNCYKDENNSLQDLNNISSKLIIEIDDSLITEDNSERNENEVEQLEDSFCHLNLNDSFNTHLHKKMKENSKLVNNFQPINGDDNSEYESLLDSLYGDSWREKQEEILPSSEPRFKKMQKKITKQIPQTERPAKITNVYKNPYLERENDSNNLLKTLQKARFKTALESPWIKSLKNICDSDTSGDERLNNLAPIKLNFKDDENCSDKQKNNKNIHDSLENNVGEKLQTKTKSNNKNRKNKSKQNTKIINKEDKCETSSYSFLASLSSNVPMSKCDMSAWIYRNSYKEHKEQLAIKLFKLYNEKIFDNAIPTDTPLEWSERMRGTAGYCYCRKITRRTGVIERAVRIVLSTKVLDSADRLRDTLVHEMCHAVTWMVNQVADGHGAYWRSWADRAMTVFPELPPIKRCHQYVINTKYTYKCTNCGYSIGRHTKSLDTERKRCGYCYGKFEVFINKTTKKGETKSVPATPRKQLNGFAQFVKDNYATHKTADLKHAEVMKILGQKFSDLKFDKS